MLKHCVVVVVAASLVVLSSAQSQECVKPPTIPSLDVAGYLGTWYEVLGLPTGFSPSGSRCIAADYGDNGDGTLSVWNRQVETNNEYDEVCGYAYQPDPDNAPGELVVVFGGEEKAAGASRQDDPPANYLIIGYEPGQWSAVYSCFQVGDFVSEYGWVLTRDNNPSQEVVDAALSAFTNNSISVDAFEPIPQGDDAQCGNYYPPEGGANCFGQLPPP